MGDKKIVVFDSVEDFRTMAEVVEDYKRFKSETRMAIAQVATRPMPGTSIPVWVRLIGDKDDEGLYPGVFTYPDPNPRPGESMADPEIKWYDGIDEQAAEFSYKARCRVRPAGEGDTLEFSDFDTDNPNSPTIRRYAGVVCGGRDASSVDPEATSDNDGFPVVVVYKECCGRTQDYLSGQSDTAVTQLIRTFTTETGVPHYFATWKTETGTDTGFVLFLPWNSGTWKIRCEGLLEVLCGNMSDGTHWAAVCDFVSLQDVSGVLTQVPTGYEPQGTLVEGQWKSGTGQGYGYAGGAVGYWYPYLNFGGIVPSNGFGGPSYKITRGGKDYAAFGVSILFPHDSLSIATCSNGLNMVAIVGAGPAGRMKLYADKVCCSTAQPDPTTPVLSMTVDVTPGPCSVEVTVTVTGGVAPYTYQVDWGDGTAVGTTAGPETHSYAISLGAGTHTVTITVKVTDDTGTTISTTSEVTVVCDEGG